VALIERIRQILRDHGFDVNSPASSSAIRPNTCAAGQGREPEILHGEFQAFTKEAGELLLEIVSSRRSEDRRHL